MTDDEAKTLPGVDPANEDHPTWAALQLARMLVDEDGFDRTKVACAFLAAAQKIARDDGAALPFAVVMHGAATSLAATAGMTEN